MSDDAPWRVTITTRAQKDFQRLSLEMQGRIRAAIDRLRQGPDHGDTRKLRGAEDGWRLRVGDWRVRFISDATSKTVIIITRILPHGRAYRD